jgi:GDP-mannose 4,6-dehydratase
MQPMSPYAVAKATSYWITRNYRAAYGIHASTGLLSNHESPLRPARFVTRKIVNGIRSIQLGQQSNLVLGNIKISRDWGWAPDFVEAIHLICSSKVPDDYIVATGKTHSLLDFIGSLSNLANLDIACHRDGQRSELEQSILMTTDGLDSSGFLEHLKLPHYVTFRSMIERKIAVRQARLQSAPTESKP